MPHPAPVPPTPCAVILYEYPFNERIRTYLRREHLFFRAALAMNQHVWCQRTVRLSLQALGKIGEEFGARRTGNHISPNGHFGCRVRRRYRQSSGGGKKGTSRKWYGHGSQFISKKL